MAWAHIVPKGVTLQVVAPIIHRSIYRPWCRSKLSGTGYRGREPRMHRTMHCLAVGQGQSWQAYCFDLDLAVEGQSFEEAQNRLKAVIASYLEAAQESGDPALLERKTPFWVRL